MTFWRFSPLFLPLPLRLRRSAYTGKEKRKRIDCLLFFFRAKIANPPSPPMGEKKRGSANCFVNTDEKEVKEGKKAVRAVSLKKGKYILSFLWGNGKVFLLKE